MLQVVSALKGYAIEATDGHLGTVSDVLFDDQTWKVRWLVVDTGSWLPGRKVLIQPSVIGAVDVERQKVSVALTKAQVKDSPGILQDKPVSRQMQNDTYGYYGWDPLWGGGMYGMYGMSAMGTYGPGIVPFANNPSPGHMRDEGLRDYDMHEGDPHLRSIGEVTGYHIHATDGSIGHIQDFIVDSESWGIRYLIVDTANWWFGQHVLISPHAVRDVDWSDHRVNLDTSRETVKASPPWDPAAQINEAVERQLHAHYNWPGYGW